MRYKAFSVSAFHLCFSVVDAGSTLKATGLTSDALFRRQAKFFLNTPCFIFLNHHLQSHPAGLTSKRIL